MIQVYVTIPVHGDDEQLAKLCVYEMMKRHFPELKWKIDGAIIIPPKRKPRLRGAE